jgi:predicted nuclease of predicted toxin-antitoxin system
MKLLFDQNISHKILKFIPELFNGSTTVKHEGLMNAPDFEIWEFAKKNGLVIVTQDSDFNDLNSLYGFPPKIIWIRTGNLKTMEIADILRNYSKDIDNFIDDNNFGCFEILKLK